MEPECNLPVIGHVEHYTLHLKLGEGGQANVYLASHQQQLYALKVYLPGNSKAEAFQLQVDFLQKLKNPLLINMVDYQPKAKIQLDNSPPEKRPMIVLELADGGQLYDYVAKQGRFNSETSRFYAKQMVSSLQFLAKNDIAHRDIKLQNILLGTNFNIKVSDFGLARSAKGRFGDYVLHSRVGTEGYRSPEMEEGKYNGLQSDMFAVGVVLFIMYNGSPPFLSTKPHDRMYKLIRQKSFSKFWEKHQKGRPEGFFEPSFKRIINSFFSADPSRRPTFQSLENDQWWNGKDLSQQELQEIMRPKYNFIFEDSPINEVKKKFFKNIIEEKQEQNIEDSCDSCTRDCAEELVQLTREEKFTQTFHNLDIKRDDLPQFTIQNIPYSNEEPAFVVAWVRDAALAFFKEEQSIVRQFVEEIRPQSFQFNYLSENSQIEIKFEYTVEDEYTTELQMVGRLHRSKKKGIGIEWVKKAGNFYWLATVQGRLVDELRHLN